MELKPLNLLTLVFIALKLTNCITWSWWWVLSPMTIPISIGVTVWALGLLCGLVATVLEAKEIKRKLGFKNDDRHNN